MTRNFSHTIKRLFHQYHKILALCNVKGELTSSFSLNIAHSQYFVVIDAITDKYKTIHPVVKGCYGINQSSHVEISPYNSFLRPA